MLSVLTNTSLTLLEKVVNTLDSYEGLQKRPRRFAKHEDKQQQQDQDDQQQKDQEGKRDKDIKADDENDDVEANNDDHSKMQGTEKFKHLSFELIDIGLFAGEKGLEVV